MDSFRGAMQTFLDDEKFSDLTIICGTTGREFKAHRVLASAHSKWFMRCCAGSFAEAQHRRVELKDDHPEALERMIQYFYQFAYEEEPKEIASGLELHAWMLVISDKYEVSDLSKLARRRFEQALRNKGAQPDLLIAAAAILYENLPHNFIATDQSQKRTPHDLLADAWVEHGSTRVRGDNAEQLMQSLLQKAPAFAVHIQSRLLYNMKESHLVRCPHCKHMWTYECSPSKRDYLVWCLQCQEFRKVQRMHQQ